MTALQIVLLSIAGAFAICSIVFMILFLIEITAKEKKQVEETEVKSIFSENYSKKESKVQTLDSMLEKLNKEAAEEVEKQPKVEPVELSQIEEVRPVEFKENAEVLEAVSEPLPEPVVLPVIPAKEEVKEEFAEESKVEEESEGTIIEEIEEDSPVEVAEEAKEDSPAEVAEEVKEDSPAEVVEEAKEETLAEEIVEAKEEVKEEIQEKVETEENKVEVEPVTVEVIEENGKAVETETISPEALLDYKSRLDKIIENRDKINKDLIKVEKSILNYERTKRRKLRNQKMLDRRASELTNLNLVMYSVTDIKNVDEDKKVKQEELTSHIAELKASIQDADEFLDSNKERNDHDVKMAKFLIQEKARYNEEISELQKLIARTEGTED